MANILIEAARDLARTRWLSNHEAAEFYGQANKMTDTELQSIIRNANTKAGARRILAGWANDQIDRKLRIRDRHDEEERILQTELSGGLSIKRYEPC